MSPFETETTTVEALIKNKRPDCVDALEKIFYQARGEKGLGLREAYHYAEITHFLADHDGHNHLPGVPFDTDEEAKQVIIDGLMETNDDGKAEDRIDGLMKWYDLFRSWDVPVQLAFTTAVYAGQEEWENDPANDLTEEKALELVKEIPAASTQERVLSAFYARRKTGENVRLSLRGAVEQVEEEDQFADFLNRLGSLADRGPSN